MAYVAKELREFWEERDPIAMYHRWLVDRAKIDEESIRRIDQEALQSIDAAVEYAEALPFPKPDTVTDRLFAPSPHDPTPEDRKRTFEPIETPAIPALTAAQDRSSGGHF
jgi:TPP-dependent pyruvate/acetoin dehydrogenase alpha subunit